MGDTHRRYEELAVTHVLGGMASTDASDFRHHLLSCRDCRRRVAELRAIATELETAERTERRRLLVAQQDRPTEGPPRQRPDRAAILTVAAGLTVVVTLAGLLLWNLSLRRVVGEYERTSERQSELVDILTAGERLDVAGSTSAVAASTGGRMAFSVSGLSPLAPREVLVAWLLRDGHLRDQRVVADSAAVADNLAIAFLLDLGDADRFVLSVEDAGSGRPRRPSGRQLASVDLSSR